MGGESVPYHAAPVLRDDRGSMEVLVPPTTRPVPRASLHQPGGNARAGLVHVANMRPIRGTHGPHSHSLHSSVRIRLQVAMSSVSPANRIAPARTFRSNAFRSPKQWKIRCASPRITTSPRPRVPGETWNRPRSTVIVALQERVAMWTRFLHVRSTLSPNGVCRSQSLR